MLPNVIIIGAMKSGTTSLYRYLEMHPEISMSKIKELDFFIVEKNFSKGLEWYESNFGRDRKICGEASPNYSKHPTFAGVPKRMHSVVPDAKLIYVLRDPIDRIISHYLHNVFTGRVTTDISAVLSNDLDNNHYVACSKYYMQLEQYLDYYPQENILVITAEGLRDHRRETLQSVFAFLGLGGTYNSPKYSRVFHESSRRKLQSRVHQYVSQKRIVNKIKPFIPQWFVRTFKHFTGHSVERPKLDPVLEARLIVCLKDDVEALRRLTPNDFHHWRL